MDDVVIGDNAHIQNSVIGHGASIGVKAQLKDCNVGHGFEVPESADHRDEKLASSKE
jgi:NDP-sugar pyrophosphorylase family protein